MIKRVVLAVLMMQLMTACASVPPTDPKRDPYESFNRQMFSFNEVVDQILLRPIAATYRYVVPQQGRTAVRNVLRNLGEPITMVNALLQGDSQRMFTSFWRFVLNSTFGFAGVYDFAGENTPLTYRSEDFGQTIAVWANDTESNYLVLPILGPSTLRDVFGRVVDIAFNPLTYIEDGTPAIIEGVAEGISKREELLDLTDEIHRTSLDPYATYRSGYLQHRQGQIKNTHNPKVPAL